MADIEGETAEKTHGFKDALLDRRPKIMIDSGDTEM